MPLVSDAVAIARAGIAAVDPARAVRITVRRKGRSVTIRNIHVTLESGAAVHLVAIGKAAAAMTDAASAIFGAKSTQGIAVTRKGNPLPRAAVSKYSGEHPVPGRGSLRAGKALLDYVARTEPRDFVLFLLSGGASAIAEVPVAPISLTDLRHTTQVLLTSGAPIQGLNVLRRHLSRLKGGRLAQATRARQWATVAISDVVGDTPWDIGSGPTVPDPTTFRDAWTTVQQFRLERRLPSSVLRVLRAGLHHASMETPKPSNPRLVRSPFVLAATNRTALAAAAVEARRRGYASWILSSDVVGETRDIGRLHAGILGQLANGRGPVRRPFCFLSGGETTVTLPPHPGRGGRNQEFALSGARSLAGIPRVVLMSLGTDGIDGSTDAAGAWVDGRTLERAHRRHLDLGVVLERHAAYDAFRRLGQLVRTGPTGTNVMDLHVALAGVAPQSRYGRK